MTTTKKPHQILQEWLQNLIDQSTTNTGQVTETFQKLSSVLLQFITVLQTECNILSKNELNTDTQRKHLKIISETSNMLATFIAQLTTQLEATEPDLQKTLENETNSVTKTDLAGVHTLLADDNPVQREIVLHQLQALGLQCTATTTENVLQLLHSAAQDNKPFQIIVISAAQYDHHVAYLGRTIRSNMKLNQVMTSLALANELPDFEKERAHFDGFACLLELTKPDRLVNKLANSWRSWAAKINFATNNCATKENHILLVEDEPIPQLATIWQLQHLGYTVDIATDGHTALKLLEQNSYDLIFMDIGLPDISGLEVTTVIRKRENNLRHVPIIGLTVYAREGNEQTGLQAGMDDYLEKPLTPDRLHVVLEHWLNDAKKLPAQTLPETFTTG